MEVAPQGAPWQARCLSGEKAELRPIELGSGRGGDASHNGEEANHEQVGVAVRVMWGNCREDVDQGRWGMSVTVGEEEVAHGTVVVEAVGVLIMGPQ
jgi:hypothetical protein